MGTDKPLVKRIWKSTAFVVVFSIFAILGIGGTVTSLVKGYNFLQFIFELIISLIIAFILGLIAYGIASLITRRKTNP
jgi:cation transporter-like permease